MKLKNLTIVGSLLALGCSEVKFQTKEDVNVNDLICSCDRLRDSFHKTLTNVERNFNGTNGDHCSGAAVDYSKAVTIAKKINDCCNNSTPEESVQAGMEVIRHVLTKHDCLPEEPIKKKPGGVALETQEKNPK